MVGDDADEEPSFHARATTLSASAMFGVVLAAITGELDRRRSSIGELETRREDDGDSTKRNAEPWRLVVLLDPRGCPFLSGLVLPPGDFLRGGARIRSSDRLPLSGGMLSPFSSHPLSLAPGVL